MAMGKKQDIISLSELAKRAGVTRGAVSLWVNRQAEQGINLTERNGRRGIVINANNPLVKSYIQNTGNSKRSERQDGEALPDTLRKLEFKVEKLRLENAKLRGKYINRDSALSFFDKLLESEKQEYKKFPYEILSKIEKVIKIKITPKIKKDIIELILAELDRAHKENERVIQDLKRSEKYD